MFSERTGIVNIGLEGMMIMGTWFGAWAAWMYGPWYGIMAGILGGAMFGLIHAVGTVTFQVDPYCFGCSYKYSRSRCCKIFKCSSVCRSTYKELYTITKNRWRGWRFYSSLFIWWIDTPSLFGYLQDLDIPFISDLGGLLLGATSNLSYISIFALALIPLAAWILWSTPFGLQMRSVGELPTE